MLSAAVFSLMIGAMAWLSGRYDVAWGPWLPLAVGVPVLAWPLWRARRQAVDRGAAMAVAGVIAVMALQAANPSHRFLPGTRALAPCAHLAFLPSSVDRPATLQAMLAVGAAVLVFRLAQAVLTDGRSRGLFAALQVASGVAMACGVLWQRHAAPDGALYAATGAFVSANHYAAFANLLMPLAILGGSGLGRSMPGTWRRVAVTLAGYVVGGVMALSVVASNSRMGVGLAGILLAACLAVDLSRWTGRALACRVRIFILALGLAALGLAALVAIRPAVMERLAGIRGQVQSRGRVAAAVIRMAGDRWCCGVGAGTFACAFPYYQPAQERGFYRHAHNEYLQVVAELGLLGAGLAGFALYRLLRPLRRGLDGTGGWRWPFVLGLGGLALHAMTDFPLRLPALALMAAAWLGVLQSPAGHGEERVHE